MFRFALLILLPLAACETMPKPVHALGPLAAGEWAWCMAPDGEIVAWTNSRQDASGHTLGTCAAPAAFVRVPACNERPSHSETPEVRAARARLGRDGSLYGDSFEGIAFCAPTPPI